VLSALVLSIALAMDATAVAAARGLTGVQRREAVLLPLLFGGFQAGMAALGWIGGRVAIRWVSAWDHWIAFGLLAFLGGRMIVAALRGGDEAAEQRGGIGALLLLSIATSIDALAAGLTLEVVGAPPLVTLLLIGVVTAALSAAGYLAGRRLGGRAGIGLEIAGGVALIAIGAKILIEHLTA
jgi:manganese efflux pump family protein